MTPTIDDFIRYFPRPSGCSNAALTGPIPINDFNHMESDIREAMRAYPVKLRVIYRGPRKPRGFGYANRPLRADAAASLIYIA